MMHIVRVYWRYYYGRLRGRDMRLFGRPGSAMFKAVRFVYAPTKQATEEFIQLTLKDLSPPKFEDFKIHGASQGALDELEKSFEE